MLFRSLHLSLFFLSLSSLPPPLSLPSLLFVFPSTSLPTLYFLSLSPSIFWWESFLSLHGVRRAGNAGSMRHSQPVSAESSSPAQHCCLQGRCPSTRAPPWATLTQTDTTSQTSSYSTVYTIVSNHYCSCLPLLGRMCNSVRV